jgi:hypothetical protein
MAGTASRRFCVRSPHPRRGSGVGVAKPTGPPEVFLPVLVSTLPHTLFAVSTPAVSPRLRLRAGQDQASVRDHHADALQQRDGCHPGTGSATRSRRQPPCWAMAMAMAMGWWVLGCQAMAGPLRLADYRALQVASATHLTWRRGGCFCVCHSGGAQHAGRRHHERRRHPNRRSIRTTRPPTLCCASFVPGRANCHPTHARTHARTHAHACTRTRAACVVRVHGVTYRQQQTLGSARVPWYRKAWPGA